MEGWEEEEGVAAVVGEVAVVVKAVEEVVGRARARVAAERVEEAERAAVERAAVVEAALEAVAAEEEAGAVATVAVVAMVAAAMAVEVKRAPAVCYE